MKALERMRLHTAAVEELLRGFADLLNKNVSLTGL